eukprot:2173389-Pyramimonas_sp.AAC.1
MEGGCFSYCGSRNSVAHIRVQSLQQFYGFSWLVSQEWCFGAMSDCQGAALTLVRGVEVLGM